MGNMKNCIKIFLHSVLIIAAVSCASGKVCYNLNDESPRIKTGLENFLDCCADKYKNKKTIPKVV